MAALQVEGLVRHFGTRPVLAGIELAIEAGEVVLLGGANGAGKSTLLRCCGGLLRPDAGCIRVDGRSPDDAARRGWLGWSAGETGFVRRLSLRANLACHARLLGIARRESHPRIDVLAREFGFDEHLDVPAERCSAGLRARAALGRALLGSPRVLLLDEPLRSIDPEGARRIASRLRARAAHAAVLWISHHASEAAEVADRALRLDHGRLHPAPRLVRAA